MRTSGRMAMGDGRREQNGGGTLVGDGGDWKGSEGYGGNVGCCVRGKWRT